MALYPTSLTGKTLLQIALGVMLVVLVSSAANYYITFSGIEARARNQLANHAAYRGHIEGTVFDLARDMQQEIRKLAIERYPQYLNAAVLARFDTLYMRYPDGAVRPRPSTMCGNDPVTAWVHRDIPLTPEIKQRIMLFHDLAEQFKPVAKIRFADIFFTAPEQLNVGTDPPGYPRWALEVPADFDQNAENYMASTTPQNNPTRQTVWSGAAVEPVWKKLMVGVATPIDINGRHIGAVHNDISVDALLDSLLSSRLEGATHVVFQVDGALVAHTGQMNEITARAGKYRMQDSQDGTLLALWRTAQRARALPVVGYEADTDQYFALSQIQGPNWYIAATLPGHTIRSQASLSAQWVLWAGLGSLVLLLAVLAVILRRAIARPLGALATAAARVASGDLQSTISGGTAEELRRLAVAFNDMVRKIRERDTALRHEKQELENALNQVRNTEERWRAMTERASDFILLLDASLSPHYVSSSLEAILGYSTEDISSRAPAELVHPEDRYAIRRVLARARRDSPGAPARQLRCRLRHRNGELRHLEALVSNLLDKVAVRGYVVNVRDITERVTAEAEVCRQQETLRQNERLAAMGSLLAGVAHELNNPLFVITGRALMLEAATRGTEFQPAAYKIRDAADRCTRIVKTFLAMARQREQHRTAVRIDEVVQSALDVLEYTLRTSGVAVEYERGADIPELLADADQLHQVFMNLCINAQQAMMGTSGLRLLRISTRYMPEQRIIQTTIVDTGPGIPADIRHRIFDPFFTTKSAGIGTGIGLSVCVGIVQAHGGTIEVSCPETGGTIFNLTLPLVAAEQTLAPIKRTELCSLRRRVLVIDDEQEVRDILYDILTMANHDVHLCPEGSQALELLSQEHFDAIICDVRMPGMDGVDVFRNMHARWPDLAQRFVFMTGDSLSTASQQFISGTGQPCIEKPFTSENICHVIDQLVRSLCSRPKLKLMTSDFR